MNIHKLLSIMLALMLTLGCTALAEEDLQAQLDAANERIAELEAQVETYYPYYISQVVAIFGNGEVVELKEVQARYDAINSQYQQSYGITVEQLGMGDTLKRQLVDSAVEQTVLLDKAEELGVDQLDEEALKQVAEDVEAQMEQYAQTYASYFHPNEELTDEIRAEAEDYYASNGILTRQMVVDSNTKIAVLDAMRDYAIKGVEVNEEDIQASYDALLAANEENYTTDSSYNNDRNAGKTIAWNPEGYRAVKQVLIQFDDDQAKRHTELQTQLDSLNSERDSIENPAEDADTSALRTLAEVDADIAACGMEIESLYAELLPEANEVIDAFNSGEDFDSLIDKYNDDPGMKEGATASAGYAVSADSTVWDPVFTDGAMGIANVGDISEPLYGERGIYIIYYMADIEPGSVPLENILDGVTQNALQEKQDAAYQEKLAEWKEEAQIEYHYESFGISEQ